MPDDRFYLFGPPPARSREDLRRFYAGLAMQGILIQPGGDERYFDFIAQTAFRLADAMLAEIDRRDANHADAA